MNLTNTKRMIDGVSAEETFLYAGDCNYPGDINGKARFNSKLNSNDRMFTNYQLFAYEVGEYAAALGQNGQNILELPAMQIELEETPTNKVPICPYNSWYSTISKDYIRGTSVATWASYSLNYDGITKEVWAPSETYLWNVSIAADR